MAEAVRLNHAEMGRHGCPPSMGQVEKVIELAQQLAEETPGFFEVKGPGVGDKATNAFMGRGQRRGVEPGFETRLSVAAEDVRCG